MSKEELLNEAKLRYPKGTKFHPVRSDTLEPSTNVYTSDGNARWSGPKEEIICDAANLYIGGVWATVISLPERYITPNTVINTYPIY